MMGVILMLIGAALIVIGILGTQDAVWSALTQAFHAPFAATQEGPPTTHPTWPGLKLP